MPQDNDIVYWVKSSVVCHTDKSCTALTRAKEIRSGTYLMAKRTGRSRVCDKCTEKAKFPASPQAARGSPSPSDIVYWEYGSTIFHIDNKCRTFADGRGFRCGTYERAKSLGITQKCALCASREKDGQNVAYASSISSYEEIIKKNESARQQYKKLLDSEATKQRNTILGSESNEQFYQNRKAKKPIVDTETSATPPTATPKSQKPKSSFLKTALIATAIIISFFTGRDTAPKVTENSTYSTLSPPTQTTAVQTQSTPQTGLRDESIVVYITRTGEKYHLLGCRYLKQSKIKTNLKEALEDGYTPCSVCKPPQSTGR